MADNSAEQPWTAQSFRQSIRGKIEEAIRQSGNPTTKSVAEMENHVFQKARNKEEYLSYIARLIIHVRETNSKKPSMPSGQTPSAAALPPGATPSNPGIQSSDPMSALRNLAGQGTASITVQQGGQPQLGTPVLGTSTIPVVSQTQVQAMSQGGIVSASAPAPNVVAPSMGQSGVAPIMMQQTRFLGPVGNIITAQPQRPPVLHNVQLQLQRSRQPPTQQQSQHPNVPNQSVPLQQLIGGFNDNISFVQSQQQSPATSQYQTGTQFQGQSPGPVGANQGPGSNQSTVPSPVQQHGTNVSNSQMAPSPAGYAPSPTSQITPSPVSYQGRAPGTAGAPSPGSALNTPGNIGTSPSPAGRAPQDDQMYLDKLKQLSKYIEPLRRMIARIDKDEDRKKELSRLNNLLDILSDPNKRCSMDILLKCEQVLEKLELRVSGGEIPVPSGSQPIVGPSKPPEQNICQPLLDVISYHIKSPLFNHTLQRTFGPAVAALNGPRTVIPKPPSKKRKYEEEHTEISNVLQGEIARLDQRFKIQLDPVQHQGSRTVHLICQLDDKNLPCVPPITIAVPENYPEKPPQCNTSKEEYDSTPFLQCIQKVLSSRLSNMPGKFSVTSLLDAWEMSVRQACSPKPTAAWV